jgi:hypothetical protein
MSNARIYASSQTTAASPLAFLHPSRISLALDQRLLPETVQKLLNCQRLHERLAAEMRTPLVKEDLWPIPTAADFLAAPAHPRDMARLAGAVWHAASLRLVVTGKAASELVAAVGEKVFTFGLRHAAMAVAPARTTRPSELAEAIDCDGLSCLGAWLAAEPKPRRNALLLRLSPEEVELARQFNPDHKAMCKAVMAVVLAKGDVG